MFKGELNGKAVTEFIALRSKVYAFLIDGFTDNDYAKQKITNKKAKGTKKCVVKQNLIAEDYKKPLFNNEVIYRLQQRFRNDHQVMNTVNSNKIALSSNDDKRLQTFDRITTYQYGNNAYKVCESEMLVKKGLKPIFLYY